VIDLAQIDVAKARGSTPPCISRLSRARDRRASMPVADLATPMIGISRRPRLMSACRAGKICRYARSPVAPKKTIASAASCAIFNAILRGEASSGRSSSPFRRHARV
jgi:hypothetical protein